MAIFKEWAGIRYIMQLLIMNLVSCLACLSAIAFAQLEFSEAVTGSVSFPDGVIACIGNLAVFFTCLLRGRLELENGARDVLATKRCPKLQKIKGSGLTTCNNEKDYKKAKVVMLSKDPSNSNFISQFMKYVHHSYDVNSILLKCLPLGSSLMASEHVTAERCGCLRCNCVVLWTEEAKIEFIIACRMPGTLKRLSGSLCLLPCWNCLTKGCHGCDQVPLQVKQIRLQSAVVTAKLCCDQFHECNCNVLWTDEEEMRRMVARWMRGTVKRLSNSLCLLPSWDCLRRGCHGADPRLQEESEAESCGQIQDDVEEIPRRLLTEKGFKAESPAAVCQMLDIGWFTHKKFDCICIPLCEGGDDEWTNFMIRFLRSKDQVSREIIVDASDAMQKYIDRSGEIPQAIMVESYSRWSLIVPRLIEVSLNIVLVGWLRVDGLSSSLIARRAVRDYLVDSKGTGFNANAFLNGARIKCNQSSVCQVLEFRGKILGVRTLSYVVGCVNLICAMSWCVLMACNGRYGIHSMPPSKPRIVVMLASIGVALLMDFVDLTVYLKDFIFSERVMVLAVIILQIGYIVSVSVIVAKGMGIGKWVYSVFQALIWVKWGIGSYLLGDCDNRVDSDRFKKHLRDSDNHLYQYFDRPIPQNPFLDRQSGHGIMMYSSVFMLNAILAGVRGKWEY